MTPKNRMSTTCLQRKTIELFIQKVPGVNLVNKWLLQKLQQPLFALLKQ
jgi:hypothetical protein